MLYSLDASEYGQEGVDERECLTVEDAREAVPDWAGAGSAQVALSNEQRGLPAIDQFASFSYLHTPTCTASRLSHWPRRSLRIGRENHRAQGFLWPVIFEKSNRLSLV